MDHLPYAIYFKDLDSRFILARRALSQLHGRMDQRNSWQDRPRFVFYRTR
jgi:hypothetical protein